jgi:hypothetical protein
MNDFDPSEIIRGIQQLLISDKKKIAFLCGAGTSFSGKSMGLPYIPAVYEMTETVEKVITSNDKYKTAIADIKEEILSNDSSYNIETLLSNVEAKIRIIGKGTLNGLNLDELKNFCNIVKNKIKQMVSIHDNLKENDNKSIPQYDFARWIYNASRSSGVEIFTTNYDYLFEIGLEEANVPYYDGFTGSYNPFFNADAVEDMDYVSRQTKLWKIHGSLGLKELPSGRIIRKTTEEDSLLIYPSFLKYDSSKKMPYTAYMDRLNAFLKQDDAVLFVCGYSFSDEHINERILSALKTDTNAHVFVLYYDTDNEIVKENNSVASIAKKNRKISVLSTNYCIKGTKIGKWKLKREPSIEDTIHVNLYFDEDAPEPNTEIGIEENQDSVASPYTGEGRFILPDYSKFVRFLINMIPSNEWEDKNKDE